jgi:hypothetical protein
MVASHQNTSPHHRCCLLVDWCVSLHFIVWWSFTAMECIFSFHFSSLELSFKTTGNRLSQMFCRGQILFRIPAPSLVLFLVGCCAVLAKGRPLEAYAVSLSIILLPHLPLHTTGKGCSEGPSPGDGRQRRKQRLGGGDNRSSLCRTSLPPRRQRASCCDDSVHPPPHCLPAPLRLAAAVRTMCRGKAPRRQ